MFAFSLTIAELRRFIRGGFILSLILPLCIGILVQIAVPDRLFMQSIPFERRAFYSIIFCFWLGITNASRRIVAERRVLNRLLIGGAGVTSIFISKFAIVIFAAIIHSIGFYSMFIVNVVDLAQESRISASVNQRRYGLSNLIQWSDRESAWHGENDDPISLDRDPYYHEKLSIGSRYDASKQSHIRWFCCAFGRDRIFNPIINLPGLFFAFFLASASAGILGLLLSALFKAGRTDSVLLCVPFVAAYQIMYAKITTGSGTALFGPFDSILSAYQWHSLYHVLSFLSYSRYLVIISSHESLVSAITSLDAYMIYSFMIVTSLVTVLLLRRMDTP